MWRRDRSIAQAFLIGGLVALMGAAGKEAGASCPAPADTAGGLVGLINFDDIMPDGTTPVPGVVVTDQYIPVGVCFIAGPDATPTILNPTPPTASEPQALLNAHGAGDVIGSRNTSLTIAFTVPMESVSMKIGWGLNNVPSWNCEVNWPGPILTGIGQTSAGMIGVVTSTTRPDPLSESVTTVIGIAADTAQNENFTSVRLDYGDCFFPEVIDDLEFVTSPVPPPADTTAPVVTIDHPADGQLFNSAFVTPPVTGTIVENSGIPPAIDVNGVSGMVTPGPTFDVFTFSVPNVSLPTDGVHVLTATATDAVGLSGMDSVTVTRSLPTQVQVLALRITQTGIIDPPSIVGVPIVQDTLIQGKTTLVRMRLLVTGAGAAASFVDTATLDVLHPSGTVVDVVGPSSYSFSVTAALDCAPFICGVNFFVPASALEGAGDVIERRFLLKTFAGGALLQQDLIGPYEFKDTNPFEIIVSPVELAWAKSDLQIVTESLDMMARTFPVGDDFGFFAPGTFASQDFTFVATAPIDLDHEPNPSWDRTYKHSDTDIMKVTWTDANTTCVDVSLEPMNGLKLARQSSHPEDTDLNGTFEQQERDRFCPHEPDRTGHERNGNLKAHLRDHAVLLELDYETLYGPAAPGFDIDSRGVYTNESMLDNFSGNCGGRASSWAVNWGASQPNCVRVVGQEYGHTFSLGHSRDERTYNGIVVPQLPGCTPEVDNDPASCTGIIPTASGAGYNLVDRSATTTPHSYMTTRTSGDNYLNCFLRNEEFRFLAENAAVGWYPPSAPATEALGPGSEGSGSPEMLMDPWSVVGTVDNIDGTVRILWAGPAPASAVASAPGTSAYSLEIKDSSGAVLLTHTLDLQFEESSTHIDEPDDDGFDPISEGSDTFLVVIALPAGADRAGIVSGARTLWSVDRGAFPPGLTLLFPGGGETFRAGEEIPIDWTVSDSDAGAPLFVRLEYSPDGGSTFLPLETKSAGTTMAWPTGLFPGGTSGLIRVTASDGFDTASTTNPTFFTLEDSEPLAQILSPLNGRAILRFQELSLRALGFDPEDGMLDGASMFWTSDRDGFLGNGRSLIVPEMSPGPHTIELSVTDSAAQVVRASVQVTVEDDTDRDGLSDDLESDLGLDPLDPSDSRQDVDDDGLNFIDETFLGTDPFNSDSDGDGLNDGDDVAAGGDPRNDDTDGDGVRDGSDNCLLVLEPLQKDDDGDGVGDVCDNCSLANPGQEDLDRDGVGDLCDQDDDNDGVQDVSDCNPRDPFAFNIPGQVSDLQLAPGSRPGDFLVSWIPSGAGSGATFDVASGLLSRLPAFGFNTAVCEVTGHPGTSFTLPATGLPAGDGLYILARERNGCGLGGWGKGADGLPRLVPACP